MKQRVCVNEHKKFSKKNGKGTSERFRKTMGGWIYMLKFLYLVRAGTEGQKVHYM